MLVSSTEVCLTLNAPVSQWEEMESHLNPLSQFLPLFFHRKHLQLESKNTSDWNSSSQNTSNQTVHYLYFVSENIYASLLHIKFQLWFSPDQSLISLCAPGGQLVDHWRNHGGPLTGPLDRPWCTRDHSLDHWTTCLAVWQSRMTIVQLLSSFAVHEHKAPEEQVFVWIVVEESFHICKSTQTVCGRCLWLLSVCLLHLHVLCSYSVSHLLCGLYWHICKSTQTVCGRCFLWFSNLHSGCFHSVYCMSRL